MSKIIVLCPDRDDDLGRKAGIKGPVIGKKDNIEAAKALMLADPGESDANTIAEAIRIANELGKKAVVVTVTGNQDRGFKADKEIARQLDLVLKKNPDAEGVYLVTDGADDDQLIPVIQSRTKILSKKTLIIKQAKELEKSYYVIKEVLRDPHFARLFFGLPGLLLLILAFFQELGVKLVILAAGVYLLLKGFGIEEAIADSFSYFKQTTSIDRASFPLYIGSLLTIILAILGGMEKFNAATNLEPIKQAASFLNGSITLFMIAVALFFLGRMGDMHYRDEPQKIKRYSLSIVTALAIWLVITKASALILGEILIDEFITWVLAAFVFSILGMALARRIYLKRYVLMRLKTGLQVYDQNGDYIGDYKNTETRSKTLLVKTGKRVQRVPLRNTLQVTDHVTVRTV